MLTGNWESSLVVYKYYVLKIFAKFRRKHLCRNLLVKKTLTLVFFGVFCEIFLNTYFFREHLWTVASGFFSQLGNKQQNWKQLFRASYDANPLNLIGWPSESSVKRIKPCLNYLKKTYQILRSNLFWSFSSFFFCLLIFSSLLSTALRKTF